MIFLNTNIEIRLWSTDSLSDATSANIIYNKPDGQSGKWTASILNGAIVYNTELADLDTAGEWQLQGEVFSSGLKRLTSITTMIVSKGI
ncbi:hypothetical protein UFOVP153_4 [uncultured Caudovirales phage]|uniref:Uncharacterized protein n=1 Tax=uncultured Caudovirales phage TaxID=2100421 RepID=A0A6J5KV19_9CAUD|nr:hypothetical protein UFOVP69_54 [uncultured Caudovirales phage]CAB5170138.1 hypothetical protein UFOVP153_4 [uncultured Caudovirales phage]